LELAARLAPVQAGGKRRRTWITRQRKIGTISPSTRCSFVKDTYLVLECCNAAPSRQGSGPVDKTVEIVILAMIAAFLGLRLYAVLGRRAEQEEEPIQGRFEGKSADSVKAPDHSQPRAAAPPRMIPGVTPAIERGLREIAAADRRFDLTVFVEGAKAAYRMVLEAFWRGDRDELGALCDRDVYQGFVAAIIARNAAGETLDNKLIRIEEVVVVAASYAAPIARIAVRFTADIAAVTRDAGGAVIAGSMNDAVETRDLWTFSRNVTSPDPDWLLDEADEG
jgi:predicted lipid-binding transport protein (Tim44 family)